MTTTELNRRQFLARVGVLGAAVGLWSTGAWRSVRGAPPPGSEILGELARDAMNGLGAFVVPGPDDYSVAQGVTSPTPGAVDAKIADFLISSADNFVPFPDHYLRPVVQAMKTGAVDSGFPPEPFSVPLEITRQIDEAFEAIFANDNTVPLSLVFAMQMNFLATRTNPASIGGPFASPFANLSYEDKVAAWELFETPDPAMVAAIDSALPEPQTETVSGVLRFAAGALLEFAAFGTYSEWSTWDGDARAITGTPVGWQIGNYVPSRGGWDDFKGYWKGRKVADR
jgi:hypothetical protein